MNPSKITTTVGLNIGKIDIAGVSFNFWDLGGQEELQSLWDKVIINYFLYIYCTCFFYNIVSFFSYLWNYIMPFLLHYLIDYIQE